MPSPAVVPSLAGVQEYRKERFLISTDPAKLDVGSIHAFLSKSFWDTQGIARQTVERAIRGSLCFGVYEGEQQIGFARVITDGATFTYLSDDYIMPSYRGRGLGKWLMQCILSHPGLQTVRRWVVVTRDARLYQSVGFATLKEPETYLEMLRSGA